MFPFQRSNTPYTSIYPFNTKQIVRESKSILPIQTSIRNSMADKTNIPTIHSSIRRSMPDKTNIRTRKPGTRKPRVIARRINYNSSNTENKITPMTDDNNTNKSVIGIAHLFK